MYRCQTLDCESGCSSWSGPICKITNLTWKCWLLEVEGTTNVFYQITKWFILLGAGNSVSGRFFFSEQGRFPLAWICHYLQTGFKGGGGVALCNTEYPGKINNSKYTLIEFHVLQLAWCFPSIGVFLFLYTNVLHYLITDYCMYIMVIAGVGTCR